jgi:Fe2+ or Zn2+ uptake regulation protein
MKDKRQRLFRMVVHRLSRFPEGGDTIEGITNWWLQCERIEESVDEVAEVLETLVEEGVVERHRMIGGTTFYKINQEAFASKYGVDQPDE